MGNFIGMRKEIFCYVGKFIDDSVCRRMWDVSVFVVVYLY